MAPQAWGLRNCRYHFTGVKYFINTRKALSPHTHWSSKKKMQREMMLGMGAEGARGWRLDSKK